MNKTPDALSILTVVAFICIAAVTVCVNASNHIKQRFTNKPIQVVVAGQNTNLVSRSVQHMTIFTEFVDVKAKDFAMMYPGVSLEHATRHYPSGSELPFLAISCKGIESVAIDINEWLKAFSCIENNIKIGEVVNTGHDRVIIFAPFGATREQAFESLDNMKLRIRIRSGSNK